MRSGPHPEPSDSPLVYLSTEFIRAKEYFEAIVASTCDAICTTDMQGRIIYFSPGAERMFGYSAEEASGRQVSQFYAGGHAEAEKVMGLLLKEGTLSNYETVFVGKGGRRVPISVSASLLKDKSGRTLGTLGISKDISERLELERRLRELSITDNLTGLYNHRHFQDQLASEIQRARRQGYRLSLVLMDLDRFKEVNDRWGHLEGDRILKGLAGILAGTLRRGVDSAYRYGGDEFVVLLPGAGLQAARNLARRLKDSFARLRPDRPASLSTGEAALKAGEDAESLLRRADEAMYRSKSRTRRSPWRGPRTPDGARTGSITLGVRV